MPNVEILAELIFEELDNPTRPMTGEEFLKITDTYVKAMKKLLHIEFSADDIQSALDKARKMLLQKAKIEAKTKGEKMIIQVRLHPLAPMPVRAHADDAGAN